jgi:RNA polymerase sigma factor (sigma-70 family)
MDETTACVLRQLLVARYPEIKARLAQRLGSSDLAGDAMQDTWLLLSRTKALGAVKSPLGYLFRIALNAARDRLIADRRYLTAAEVDSLVDIADEAPDPANVVEARSDLRELAQRIAGLPPRRRQILIAARLDRVPQREIADRLGISLSSVEKELRLALEACVLPKRNGRSTIPSHSASGK